MSARTDAPAVALISSEENWPRVFEVVNVLLLSGKRVLIVTDRGTSDLPLGTFVVPLATGFDPWFDNDLTADTVVRLASDRDVLISVVSNDASLVTIPARSIRVGVYGSGGAPFNHASILARCGFPWRFISASDVRAGMLREIDVFVMPGGGARSVMGEVEPLGEAGCEELRSFVRRGGMYIGCCAGSYACIVHSETFQQRCPVQVNLQLLNARPTPSDTAKGRFGFFSPGVGAVRVANQQPTHPVMYGMPAEFPIVHYNGPVFETVDRSTVDGASEIVGLASFAGWTDQFTPSERFQGETVPNEATYLSTSIADQRHAIVAGEYGLGRVVGFGSHPEFGFDHGMMDWGLPARMFANAILWRSWSPEPDDSTPTRLPVARRALPSGSSLDHVVARADSLLKQIALVAQQSIEPTPSWLQPTYALSTFGKTPTEIWTRSLAELTRLTNEVKSSATSLRDRIQRRETRFTRGECTILDLVDRLCLDRQPPEWHQDHGYQGVVALLQTATTKCATALTNWQIDLPTPTGAYDHVETNPYHLIAASYLGALGQVVGALQLLRAMDAEWSRAERLAGGARIEVRA